MDIHFGFNFKLFRISSFLEFLTYFIFKFSSFPTFKFLCYFHLNIRSSNHTNLNANLNPNLNSISSKLSLICKPRHWVQDPFSCNANPNPNSNSKHNASINPDLSS